VVGINVKYIQNTHVFVNWRNFLQTRVQIVGITVNVGCSRKVDFGSVGDFLHTLIRFLYILNE